MTKEQITYNEYSSLCNRIVGWLTKHEKELNKREVYSYEGREADPATIEEVALERYEQEIYGEDGLVTEYFECAVVDNDDYSFMPEYVTSQDGERYSIESMMSMARRVSEYEVINGESPNIIYVNRPKQEEGTVDNLDSGVYEQILNMETSQFRQSTDYYCAPNSMQCMIYYLTGHMISESTLARVGGTTTYGTGHYGIECMVEWFNRNYDESLSIEWASFNDYGFSGVAGLFEQDRTGVFFHLLYRNRWGHYEVPRVIDLDEGTIEVYNSLSGGYVETRSFSTQRSYLNGISQPSMAIVRRID